MGVLQRGDYCTLSLLSSGGEGASRVGRERSVGVPVPSASFSPPGGESGGRFRGVERVSGGTSPRHVP